MPMPRAPHHDRVLPLAKQGLRPLEIAQRLNLPPSKVRNSIQFLRRAGKLPIFKRKDNLRPVLRYGNVRLGSVADRLREAEPDFQSWLLSQVPEGSSVADLAMAAIYDVYLDEKQP